MLEGAGKYAIEEQYAGFTMLFAAEASMKSTRATTANNYIWPSQRRLTYIIGLYAQRCIYWASDVEPRESVRAYSRLGRSTCRYGCDLTEYFG